MMSAAEQICFASYLQRRPASDVARILNRIPAILCGRSRLYDASEVRAMTRRLAAEYRRGELVEVRTP